MRFEDLIRAGELPVLRMLARSVSPSEARELLQETLVRAYVAMERGQHPDQPVAWLLGIARHVLLELLRRRDAQRRLEQRLAMYQGSGWEIQLDDPTEERLVVVSALDELPTELREPILLHYYGGLPVAEVASHLSLTTGAVKMRLRRARQALRPLLAEMDERKETFVANIDIAADSRRLAEQAPVYDALNLALRVGVDGVWTSPWWPGAKPSALALADMQVAIHRLREARVAGRVSLSATLTTQCVPDVLQSYDPFKFWQTANHGEDGFPAGHASVAESGFATDGWRIATDPHWRHLLERLQGHGLRTLYFTFTGLNDTHDELAGRPGAFDAAVRSHPARPRSQPGVGGLHRHLDTQRASGRRAVRATAGDRR